MSIYAIYFSPTGGTEKIVTFIAEQFGEYQSIDLCEKTSGLTNDFSKEDLCIIGVPSFGGRVPAIALERIKALSGNNATAILITVYGNRAYEDTLIELEDTLIEKNFTCQAAIAAVAEHSIMHQFATGRPDQNDLTELASFAQKIKEKTNNTVKTDFPPVHVPGNRPYREHGTIPLILVLHIPVVPVDCAQRNARQEQFHLTILSRLIRTNVFPVCAVSASVQRIPAS